MLESIFVPVELMALALRQQRDFDRFEFARVYEWVSPIEAKNRSLATSEAVTTPRSSPWDGLPTWGP